MSCILSFDSILVVDFYTEYSTCVNKGPAEITHVNWDPEENTWALRILYHDKRFAERLGRDSFRFSEKSAGAHRRNRVISLHLGWEAEVLSGALNIESSDVIEKDGVNESSPVSVS